MKSQVIIHSLALPLTPSLHSIPKINDLSFSRCGRVNVNVIFGVGVDVNLGRIYSIDLYL